MLSERQLVPLRGLGTLVAHTVAARMAIDSKAMLPPTVQLSLIPGEGAGAEEMVARVASGLKLPATEAIELWDDTVSEWRFVLSHGGSVFLEGIGTLQKEPDGRVRLRDTPALTPAFSYGLQPVAANVLPQKGAKVIKLPDVDVRKAVRYAAAAAVLAFTVWIPLSMQQQGTLNLSLAPILNRAEATYTPREFNAEWDVPAQESTDPFGTTNDSIATIDLSGSGHTVHVRIESPVEADSIGTAPFNVTSSNANGFDIVVAEFESNLGARGHAAELRIKGMEADYIGEHNGKHLVSIGHFGNEAEAQDRLNSAKNSHHKAYVLAR
jgi:hypothetical protein